MVRGIMQEPVLVAVVNVMRVATQPQERKVVALVQTVRFQQPEQKAAAFVRMVNMLIVPIRNVKRVQLATTVQAV